LTTEGTTKVHIATNGFVGVGTTTPASLFNVKTEYIGGDSVTDLNVTFGGQVTIARNHSISPVISTGMPSGRPKIILSNTDGIGTHTVISSQGDPSYFASAFLGVGTNAPDTQLTVESTSALQAAKFTGNGVCVNHPLGSQIFIGTQTGTDGKIGTETNNQLSLYSNGYANRLDILANGDAILRNGNFQFPNGQGIDFSASEGAGASSSLLDDYEEGTWTPQARDNFSGGNQGSFSFAEGFYTKIGNQVNIWGRYSNVNTTGMNGSFDMCIAGLPFVNGAHTNVAGQCSLVNTTFNTEAIIGVRLEGARSSFRFLESASGSTVDFLTVSQFSNGTADAFFHLVYFV
jgi:hypothetical protein